MPTLDIVDETVSTTSRVGAKKTLPIRWMVGGGSTVVGAVLAIASYWVDPVRICRESECNPWGIVELIPFLVIAILAILPDLSEVTIGSIVSLKRRVEVQEDELDRTVKRQESVEQQILQLANVSASQQVTQQFFTLPAGSATRLPDDVLDKKERLFGDLPDVTRAAPGVRERPYPPRIPGMHHVSDYSPEDAQRALQLIEQWEGLDQFVVSRYPTDPGSESGVEQLLRKARRNFSRLFADELDMIRSVRNNIAHARYVATEDLQGALEAAEELHQILTDTNLVELAEL
ncbi:hypothetical protein [Actinophytocola sediminis]